MANDCDDLDLNAAITLIATDSARVVVDTSEFRFTPTNSIGDRSRGVGQPTEPSSDTDSTPTVAISCVPEPVST